MLALKINKGTVVILAECIMPQDTLKGLQSRLRLSGSAEKMLMTREECRDSAPFSELGKAISMDAKLYVVPAAAVDHPGVCHQLLERRGTLMATPNTLVLGVRPREVRYNAWTSRGRGA
jgi:hypothetical protein